MKHFYMRLRLIIFLILISGLISAKGQTAGNHLTVETTTLSDVTVCGEEVDFTVEVVNTSTSLAEGVRVLPNMPVGMEYANQVTATINGSPATVTCSNCPLTNANEPEFTVTGSLSQNDVLLVTFSAKANCGIIGFMKQEFPSASQGSVHNDTRVLYSVAGNPFFEDEQAGSNSYNVKYGDLEIRFETGDESIQALRGQNVLRNIIIRNTGFGAVSSFTLNVTLPANGGLAFVSLKDGATTLTPTTGTNTYSLTITDFTNATSGTNTDNGLLEKDEILVLTEEIEVLSCIWGMQSNYVITWGCNNEVCNNNEPNAQVAGYINPAFPSISLESALANSPQADYCANNTRPLQISISNNSTITSLNENQVLDLALTLDFQPGISSLANFAVGSQAIAGTTNASQITVSFADVYTTDPDGAGGLSDIDGDGFFDDLAPGATITLEADFSLQCTAGTCNNSYNRLLLGFKASGVSHCGWTVEEYPKHEYREIFTFNNASITGPVDLIQNQTETFTFSVNSSSSVSSALLNTSAASFTSTFTLPEGVELSGVSPIKWNGQIVSYTQSGSTVTATGGGWSGQYTVDVVLTCNTPPTQAMDNFEWSMSYQNCSGCIQNLVCKSHEVFLHCPNCAGLHTTALTVERTTLGWLPSSPGTYYDEASLANPANKIDPNNVPSNVRLDAAYECDNIRVTAPGYLSKGSLTYDNLHVELRYTFPGTINQNVLQYIANSGQFTIVNADLGVNTVINSLAPVITQDGNTWIFDFEADFPVGFTLSSSDNSNTTIDFQADMRVAEDVMPSGAHLLQRFRAEHFAVVGTGRESCESFGESFTLIRRNVKAYFTSINTLMTCNKKLIAVALEVEGMPANVDDFPNEFRPLGRLNSVVVTLPPDVKYLNNSTVSRTYHNGHLDLGNPDQIVVNAQGRQVITWNAQDHWQLSEMEGAGPGDYYRFEFGVQKQCNPSSGENQQPAAEQTIGNVHIEYEYSNRAYSNCAIQRTVTGTLSGAGFSTTISLSANALQEGYNQTEEVTWPVLVSNGFGRVAENTWVTFEAPSNITLTKVSNPNGTTIPFSLYESSATNNRYVVQLGNLATGAQREIRFTAAYSNCTDDAIEEIIVRSSFKCREIVTNPIFFQCNEQMCDATLPGYNNNPAYSNCDIECGTGFADCGNPIASTTLQLRYKTANLQWLVKRTTPSADLCGDVTYEVDLLSSQSADMDDIFLELNLPDGVTLDQNSFELSFPSATTAVPVSVTSCLILEAGKEVLNLSCLSNAFAPFIGTRDLTKNNAKLKFKVTTACGFDPGAPLLFKLFGNTQCGTPIELNAQNKIKLTGFDLDNLRLTMEGEPYGSCGNLVSKTVKIKNIGTISSNVQTLTVKLPVGVLYENGSASPAVTSAVVDVDGSTILTWPVAAGIGVGATVNYSFQSRVTDNLLTEVELQAITKTPGQLICVTTGAPCDIDGTTGSYIHQEPVNSIIPVLTITGSPGIVCHSTPVTLTAVSSTGLFPGTTYQWYKDGTPIAGATGLSYTFTLTGPVTISFSASNNTYCGINSPSVFIDMYPAPGISLITSGLKVSCPGAKDAYFAYAVYDGTTPYQSVILTGTDIPAGGENITSSSSYSGLGIGNYVLTVTDAVGCIATKPFTVTSGGPVITVCHGNAGCDGSALSNSIPSFQVNREVYPSTGSDGFDYTVKNNSAVVVASGTGALYGTDVNIQSSLPSGTYTIDIITNGDNCQASSTLNIVNLGIDLKVFNNGSPLYDGQVISKCIIECVPDPYITASITLQNIHLCSFNGASLDYTLSFYKKSGEDYVLYKPEVSAATADFGDLTEAGDYKVVANVPSLGCSEELEFTYIIAPFESPLKVYVTHETCQDANDGTAYSANTQNLVYPIYYEWYDLRNAPALVRECELENYVIKEFDEELQQIIPVRGYTLKKLAPGRYGVRVKDATMSSFNYYCGYVEFYIYDYQYTFNAVKQGIEPIDEPLEYNPEDKEPRSPLSVGEPLVDNCSASIEVTAGTGVPPYNFTYYKITGTGTEAIEEIIYTESLHKTSAIISVLPSEYNTAGSYKVKIWDAYKCDTITKTFELAPTKVVPTLCFRWKGHEAEENVVEPTGIPVINGATIAATEIKNALEEKLAKCIEREKEKVDQQLKTLCLSKTSFKDELSMEYSLNYHHYTLYYYDRSGSLTKTVSPEGVNLLTVKPTSRDFTDPNNEPDYSYATTYGYNSIKQLVKQNTPDGGTSHFLYNNIGQLRFSQNAGQASTERKPYPMYSYTKYDPLGRVIEVGEAAPKQTFAFTDLDNASLLEDMSYPSIDLTQQTQTVYSQKAGWASYMGLKGQRFLQNRVSYTYTHNLNGESAYTYYSYDPHGNVEWVMHTIPGLSSSYIGYEYDLISGKVLKVKYNEYLKDKFFHKYNYDEENRITSVETSRDNCIWDKDGSYTYYTHGPLRKTVLGHTSVQGLDYTYTLQGWLKGINSPDLTASSDPGKDGSAGSKVAKDQFGMVLGYYEGDFTRSYQGVNSVLNSQTSNPFYLNSGNRDLYNGNISSWTSNMGADLNVYDQQLTGHRYTYDRLNRLKQASFNVYNTSTQAFDATEDYKETFSYDGNGNILSMNRNGYGSEQQMDQLVYVYETISNGNAINTNKLRGVTDNAPTTAITEDLEAGQGVTVGNENYVYDEIGNLIEDKQEQIKIVWNVYGKVSEVIPYYNTDPNKTQKPWLRFTYDASGNRIKKEVNTAPYDATGNAQRLPENITTTYYVRDASGNIMANYERSNQAAANLCKDLQMVAVREYTSNETFVAERTFTTQHVITIPEEITVTEGGEGTGQVVLTYKTEAGPDETLTYTGGTTAGSYVYDNTLNSGKPLAGSTVITDYLSLEVVSGDDTHASGKTKVSMTVNVCEQGIHLATYKVTEQPIYGSDRLGQYQNRNDGEVYSQLFQSEAQDQVSFDQDIRSHQSEEEHLLTGVNKTDDAGIASSEIYDLLIKDEFPVNATPKVEFAGTTGKNLTIGQDETGEVAFYAVAANYWGEDNTLLIYDQQGKLMPNSGGIQADTKAKSVAFKKPGDASLYYLLTRGADGKLYYHLIDKEADGNGLLTGTQEGDVILKNHPPAGFEAAGPDIATTTYGRHMAAIEDHINGKVYVYATQFKAGMGSDEDSLIVARITFEKDGTHKVEKQASIVSRDTYGDGDLQISADGKELLLVNYQKTLGWFTAKQAEIVRFKLGYDFSISEKAGVIEKEQIALTEGAEPTVGLEGSKDGKYVYYTQESLVKQENGESKVVKQWDKISSPEVIASDLSGEIRRAKNTASGISYYLTVPNEDGYASWTQTSSGTVGITKNNLNISGKRFSGGFSQQNHRVFFEPVSEGIYVRESDNKLYELKDHLGNVRVVVTDQKVASLNGNGNLISLTARIENAYNYYSFGMAMPGRTFSGVESYRYGFNGKEKDSEWNSGGAMYDYGFRIYDPRIAKFLSVDPLTASYPMLTPYQFASNTPIWAIDLDGLEAVPYGVNWTNAGEHAKITKQTGSAIYKAAAVKAFQSVFSHSLPKKFIRHYAYGEGKPLNLTPDEMSSLNVERTGLQGLTENDIKQFYTILSTIKPGETKDLNLSIQGAANLGGTLGRFTINFKGKLTVDPEDASKWSFEGTMEYYDIYDFKTNSVGEGDLQRSDWGNTQTEVAEEYLPGTGYEVKSPAVKVKQTSEDDHVDYYNGKSTESIQNEISNSKDANTIQKER